MKRAGLTAVVAATLFSLATICFLTEIAYAASPKRPIAKNSSTNYYKQTQVNPRNPRNPSNRQRKRGINLSSWTPDTPLAEAIDILRGATTPPLNILVLWRDLEDNADVGRDTPIGMQAVSGVSLRKNLELLLLSVSAGSVIKLDYVVKDGVIIIATKDALPSKMETRVYDVTDLLSSPANYYGMGGMMSMMGGLFGMPYGGGMGGMYGGQYGGMGGMYGGQYGGMSGMYGGGGQYGMPYGGGQYGMPYGGGQYGRPYGGTYGTFYGPQLPRPYTGRR